MPVMKFGKYQGQDYSTVPTDYIEWIRDDTKKKLAEFERELQLRKDKAENSWMRQIIDKGYTYLTVLDATAVDHKKLNIAYNALKAAIDDAAEPKGN